MTSPGSNDVEIEVSVRDLASAGFRGIAAAARGLAAGVGPVMALGKGLASIGAAGGAIPVVAGLGSALAGLAPAALLLPGAMLAGAAAVTTLKLAFSGMGDAISAADPAAFAEATKDMAPAARDTAAAVRDLKPAFLEVKQGVQAAFFDGLAPEIQRIGGTYMPILREGLSGISVQLGGVAKGLAQALQAPSTAANFRTILDNTALSLTGMQDAAGDLAQGFLELGAFGTSYFGGLGDAIGDAAARFREWVTAGVESDAFADAIERAGVIFGQLGEIAGNVGSTISSIFSGLAGGEDYSVFLDNLVELTGAVREFFASVAAQEALGALGEALRAVSSAMGDVLLAALQAVAPVITALAPVVVALAEAFRAALVDSGLLTTIGTLLANLVTVLVDSGLLDAFVTLAGVVGGALAQALVALSPVLIEIATAIGTLLTEAITQLVDSGLLQRMVDVIVRVLQAVLPLIPPILELAAAALPLFVGAIEMALGPLEFLASAIEFVSPIVRGLIEIVAECARALTGDFSGIQRRADEWRAGIGRAVDGVVAWFRDLPGRVLGFLAALPGQLADSGWRMIQSFADGIRRAFDRAVGVVRDGIGAIRRLFPFSPAKEGPFSGAGYVDVSGAALVGDFAAAIQRSTPAALRAASSLAGGVRGALAGAATGVGVGMNLPGAVPTMLGVDQAAMAAAAGGASVGVMPAALELRVAPGAQNALAELIMRMVRTGELQIRPVAS